MSKQIRLGVIGADDRTAALRDRLRPESPFWGGAFSMTHWAPTSDWQAVVRNPEVEAVYVGGPQRGRAEVAAAALAAGKHVLCPLPVALTADELAEVERAQRESGAVLYCPTDLRASLAGEEALKLVAAGQLGALHAIYLGAHSRMPAPGAQADVLASLGWEGLDYVLACAAAAPQRVYAVGGRLFGEGAGQDSLLVTIRFADEMVATVELAQSLPAEYPAPAPELEVELTGAVGALRVDPNKVAVAVYSPDVAAGEQRRPWQNPPVVAMLEAFQTAVTSRGAFGPNAIAQNRAVVVLMDTVRRSLASGNAEGM